MPQNEVTMFETSYSPSTVYRYDTNRLITDVLGKKLKDFDKTKTYKKGDMIYRREGDVFIFYKANKDIAPGQPFKPADWDVATDEDKTNIIGSGGGGGNIAPNPLKSFSYFKGYNHAERTALGVEACVRRAMDYGVNKYMVLQLMNDDMPFPIRLHKDKKKITIPESKLLPPGGGENINAAFIHIDYDMLDKSGDKIYTNVFGGGVVMGSYLSTDYIEFNVSLDIDYFGGYSSGNTAKKFYFRLGVNTDGEVSLEVLNKMLIQPTQFTNYVSTDSPFNEISEIDISVDDLILNRTKCHFIIHNIFVVLCNY